MSAPEPAIDRIVRIFRERLQIAPPDPEADLLERGVLDSAGFLQLFAALEEEFAIEIHLDDVTLESFRSIAGMAEFVTADEPRQAGR